MTGEWHFHIAVSRQLLKHTKYVVQKNFKHKQCRQLLQRISWGKISQFLLPWINKIHFWWHLHEPRDPVRQWSSLIRVITTMGECGTLELWWLEWVKFDLFHGIVLYNFCFFFLCLNVTTTVCQLTRGTIPHLQF